MTVCRYFKQGNCRNGARCNFEHPRDYKQGNTSNSSAFGLATKGFSGQSTIDVNEITEDTIRTSLTTEAPQWPLTCFCPLRSGSSNLLSGFDVSFEEVRLGAYEAARTNSFPAYEAQINSQLQAKASRVQVVLSNLKEAVKFAKETNANTNSRSVEPFAHGPQSALSNSAFNSANAAFQTPSNFSGSNTSSNPFSMNSGSAFASGSTPMNSDNFSSPFTSVAAPPTSAFGVQAQPATFGTSTLNTLSTPFGSLNSNPTPSATSTQSVFGTPPLVQHSAGPSAFGQPAIVGQATRSVFGQPAASQSVFGQSIVTQPGFGQSNTPQPVFGSAPISGSSSFGQSAFNQNAAAFHNTQSASGTTMDQNNSFSAEKANINQAPMTSYIDNAHPNVGSNGNPVTNGPQSQSSFFAGRSAFSLPSASTGGTMNGAAVNDSSKSAFGSIPSRHKKRPPVSEAFQKQIRDNPVPLSAEDIEQYKNATFGEKIPENPPSLELIHD